MLLNTSLIGCWIRGTKSPLRKLNKFHTKPSPELAYVVGVKAGDGYSSKRANTCVFGLNVVDYEFAEKTGRLLARLLGRREPYRPRWDTNERRWCVRGYSILLYRFLQQPLEKLKPYIEHCKHCVAAFLRAFFDGEGSIKARTLVAYNADKELLLYIKQLLVGYFAIETTGPFKIAKAGQRFRSPSNGKTYRRNRTQYYLYIRAKSLPQFQRYVGFSIGRKQRRLMRATQG